MKFLDDRKKKKEAFTGDILVMEIGDEERYYILSEGDFEGKDLLLLTDLEGGSTVTVNALFEKEIITGLYIEEVEGYITDVIQNQDVQITFLK